MKNRFQSILILLLLLISAEAEAQESILLQGKITADSLGDTSVNIINLTQGTGTTNLPNGEFQIEVQLQDTLYFSAVNFELLEQPITEEIYNRGFLEVELKEGISILQEVFISDIDLTGNLETDLSTIPVFDQEAVGFPLPNRPKMTSIQRKLYSASNSGTLVTLINHLTGEIKKLKKARENEKLRMLVERGMKAIPLTVFVEEFLIPEEHVINFVYYCAEEDPRFKEIVEKDAPLELIEYYKPKVSFFLENRMGK